MYTTPYSWLTYHLIVSPTSSASSVDRPIAEPLAKVDTYARNQYANHFQSFNLPVKYFTLDSCVSDLSTHTGF